MLVSGLIIFPLSEGPARMTLSWSRPADIAAALLKAYPEADRLALGHAQILEMILNLPEFRDTPSPPKNTYLDHVKWTWMRLADV